MKNATSAMSSALSFDEKICHHAHKMPNERMHAQFSRLRLLAHTDDYDSRNSPAIQQRPYHHIDAPRARLLDAPKPFAF